MTPPLLKSLASHVRSSNIYYQSIWLHDRAVSAAVRGLDRRTGDESRNPASVLIAAPGHGNIGDQAMLESYLDNTPGDVVVVLNSRHAGVIPAVHRERTTVAVLPRLIDGNPLTRIVDVVRFARLVGASDAVRVIGADLMDGLYNPSGSIARSSCLRIAADRGRSARILGFSWPAAAHPAATRALRAAGARIECMARDPLSARRLRASGVLNVTDVADSVFALAGEETHPPFTEWAAELGATRRIAIVNMSALIGAKVDQVDDYREVVRTFASLGYAIVMLPHVMRESGDDSCEIQKLRLDDLGAEYMIVNELLTPRQVRWIASRASIVVTGRMHLAITSLNCGAIPVTLGTQGKVEGLYQLFTLGDLEVDPQYGFGTQIANMIGPIDATIDDRQVRLAEDIAAVRELALLNFAPFDTVKK